MKSKNTHKEKKQKKHKKGKKKEKIQKEGAPAQEYRKKAPRRKVKVEIEINKKAFKGTGSTYKLFS